MLRPSPNHPTLRLPNDDDELNRTDYQYMFQIPTITWCILYSTVVAWPLYVMAQATMLCVIMPPPHATMPLATMPLATMPLPIMLLLTASMSHPMVHVVRRNSIVEPDRGTILAVPI